MTIIVLLILAGISIATLTGDEGILNQAVTAGDETNEATQKEQIKLSYNSAKVDSKGKEITETQLQEELRKYDSGAEVTKDGENFKIKFTNGNIYTLKKDGTIEKTTDSNESKGETASTLKNRLRQTEEQDSVIGKEVTELNLSVDPWGEYEWLIFDVDDTNIYLIAKDYIEYYDMPEGRDGTKLNQYEVKPNVVDFNDIINSEQQNKYVGSEDITNPKIQNLNKSFFEGGYSSTDENMRAVAYMLDTKIWTQKFIGNENGNSQVEFVIGSPSVEQLLNSYNKKYGTNKSAKVFVKESDETSTGYKISNGGTTDDDYQYLIKDMLENGSSDSTYYTGSSSKCKGMWLASPSAEKTTYVMSSSTLVSRLDYDGDLFGLRPIICLNSNVHLEEQEGGSFVIK